MIKEGEKKFLLTGDDVNKSIQVRFCIINIKGLDRQKR